MTVIRQRAAVDGVVAGAAAWHGPDVRRCGPGSYMASCYAMSKVRPGGIRRPVA